MQIKKELEKLFEKLIELQGLENEETLEILSEEELFEKIFKQMKILKEEVVSYKNQLEEGSIMLETQLEEISKTYEEISTLYEVTSDLSKSLNPLDVVDNLVESIRNSIPSEAIGIFIEFEGDIIFRRRICDNSHFLEKQDDFVRFSKDYIKTPNLKTSILEEKELCLLEIPFTEGMKSLIMVPIGGQEKNWGIIALANRELGQIFTAGDRKLLESIANQINFSLENFLYLKEKIKQERFFEQLAIAKDIQRGLLPSFIPIIEGLDISTSFFPAIEVAGDYYDLIEKEDWLFLVVADVSGKGVPASLLMSSFRSAVRILIENSLSLPDLMCKVNDHISQNEIADRFVTSVFIRLEYKNSKMKFVNAGHDPIILYRPSQDRFFELSNDGIPVGIFSGEKFIESEFDLEPEDVFIVYTDGIPEARNSKKEEFGFDRIKKIIRDNFRSNSETIKNEIISELKLFSGNAPQHDDITSLIIKFKG